MYTYNDLLNEMPLLEGKGAEAGYIGASVSGRMIPVFHAGGFKGRQALIQGAIHGREHITAKLIVMQIYYTLQNADELDGGIYFIPMSNPDGVSLCQYGLDSVKNNAARKYLLNVNGGSADFSLWKANINAVDLNCNFPARWGTGAQNVFAPAPESYAGPRAASESETRALMEITQRVKPGLTISYHCKGREIYWQFHQAERLLIRDGDIAEIFAAVTGYAVVDGDRGSAGGYKDWCIERFKIPAYTFEIVDDSYSHPVPYSALDEEFSLNKDIPKLAADILKCIKL